MNINAIKDGAKHGKWLNSLPDMAELEQLSPLSRSDFNTLYSGIMNSFKNRQVIDSANYLIVTLVIDSNRIENRLRRDGLLRPSKTGEASEFAQHVLDRVLDCDSFRSVNARARAYLHSIRNLHEVWAEIETKESGLIQTLKFRGGSFLKRVLARIEVLFFTDMCVRREPWFSNGAQASIEHWSREDLAEAFSYLLHLFSENVGEFNPVVPIGQSSDAEAACDQAIVTAALIRKFHEWEILVDGIGYQVVKSAESTFSLTPPSEDFEKSLGVGFILSQFSYIASHRRVTRAGNVLSIERLAKLAWDKNVVRGRLREIPFDAIRLDYSTRLYEPEFLGSDELYEEELVAVEHFVGEWLLDVDELLDFAVAKDVRIRDLLILQRLSRFLSWSIANFVESHHDHESIDAAVLESAIMVRSARKFRREVSKLIPENRIESVLSFLAWDSGRNEVFDVQYQPILRHKNLIAILPSIFSCSSLIRNCLKLGESHSHPASFDERFPKLIDDAFAEATLDHSYEIRYSYKGEAGEIDCIARVGDTLFIGEVKAPVLPATAFELRTSWDHIQKAISQLDKLRLLLQDEEFREYLGNRIGFSIVDVDSIATAIVMSNRMFSGLKFEDHTITGAFDLIGFVKNGVVQIGDERRCLWKGDVLEAADLREFLNGSLTYQPLLKAMQRKLVMYEIGNNKFSIPVYRLDMHRAAELMGFNVAAREMRSWISTMQDLGE